MPLYFSWIFQLKRKTSLATIFIICISCNYAIGQCSVPSTLPLTNQTIDSADFNWTENGTATEWDLEYGLEGFDIGSGTQNYGLTNTTQTLTGLLYPLSYDVYVRAKCGSSDSEWVGPFNFIVLIPGETCSNAINMNIESSPFTFQTNQYLDNFTHCSLSGLKDMVLCADVAADERITITQTSTIENLRLSLRNGPCLSGSSIVCDYNYSLEPFVYDNLSSTSEQICFFIGANSSSGDLSFEWAFSTALPVASNDNCATATDWGTPQVEGTCSGGVSVEEVDFSSVSLADSNPSCVSYFDVVRDVYYSFNGPVSGAVTFNLSFPDQFTGYNFKYVVAIYDECSGTEMECLSNYTQNAESVQFSGLIEGESYVIRYMISLDEEEYFNIQSDVCLEETCPTPTQISSSNITDSSCDINWNENVGSSWEIEWATSYYDLVNGNGTLISNITSMPYALTGLSGGITYYYRLRSDCSSYNSDWSNYYTFITTPIGENCDNYLDLETVTSPYTFSNNLSSYLNDITMTSCDYINDNIDLVVCLDLEDDERIIISGEIPGFYDSINGALEVGACGTGEELFCESYTDGNNFHYDNRSGGIQQVCYFVGRYDYDNGAVVLTWSVEPAPPLASNDDCATPIAFGELPAEGACPDGVAVSSIDFSVVEKSESSASPSCHYYGLHDVFYSFTAPSSGAAKFSMSNVVGGGYSPDFGAALFDMCSGTELACEGISETNSFNVSDLTAGDTYIIQYYFEQNYSGDEDPFITVDVCMEAACPVPSGFQESGITMTTVDCNWSANGADLWDLEYSTTSNFSINNTLITGVSDNPYTITGLTEGTNYYYRLRPDCGGDVSSDWTSAEFFKTLANGDNCTNYIDLSMETSPYTFVTNIYNFVSDFDECGFEYETDMVLCLDLENEEQLEISAEIPGYDSYIRAMLEKGSCGEGMQIGCSSYADEEVFVYANYSGSTEQVCFFVGRNDGGGYVEVTWTKSDAPAVPSNDLCADAIDLGMIPDGGSCPDGSSIDTVDFTAVPFSESSEGPSCLYYGLHDVFYTFEAPSTGAVKVDINYISDNVPSQYSTNFYFTAYDACNGTQVSCDNVTSYYDGELTGLTPGEEYILQYAFGSNYSGDAQHNYKAGFCLEALCAGPVSYTLNTENETQTTADASWVGNTGGTWEIEWGARGFNIGTGTLITDISENSHTITDLPPGARLSYYVRSNCGDSNSDWSGPYNFITKLSCGQNFTDSGGANGDYSFYEDEVWTICPTVPTDRAYVDFTQFVFGSGDGITFYNGNSTDASTIRTSNGSPKWYWNGSYGNGNLVGKRVVSTSDDGCLTMHIETNSSNNYAGFDAIVNCISAPGFTTAVVPQDAGVITSNKVVIDGDEWTHYINETSGYLMLSLFEADTDVEIPTNGVTVGAGSGVVDVSDAPYVTNNTWMAMNRYWDVNAVEQPSYWSTINVRFYYSTEDFMDIADIEGQNIDEHTDLTFYKINGDSYDPNPNNGHENVNSADYYNVDGYWEYVNGSNASTSEWAYMPFGNGHRAEIEIKSFSGGGAGAGVNGSSALPVELLEFKADAIENRMVRLSWVTASEVNNEGFGIERSNDGLNWQSVTFIEGRGNSTEENDYSYDDLSATQGINYYRLKQMDLDGRYEYSDVRFATIVKSIKMDIYPNPTKDDVIYLSFGETISGKLSIYDANGQSVLVKNVENADSEYKLNLPTLSQGVYLAKLQSGDDILMSRFVVQ